MQRRSDISDGSKSPSFTKNWFYSGRQVWLMRHVRQGVASRRARALDNAAIKRRRTSTGWIEVLRFEGSATML